MRKKNEKTAAFIIMCSKIKFTWVLYTDRKKYSLILLGWGKKQNDTKWNFCFFFRAAAKCNKGIQILFGICIEPFVLVVAKVQRGPYYADMCSVKIRPLLHCQICEERTFCPETKAPMGKCFNKTVIFESHTWSPSFTYTSI